MSQQKSNQVTDARSKEYVAFTKAAAKRITVEFGLGDRDKVLFEVIRDATRSYEGLLLAPDYQQMKDARIELSTALGKTAATLKKDGGLLERQPQLTLMLRELGELLTYGGLETLLGRRVGRRILPGTQPERHEEMMRVDRAAAASRAGPDIIIALLERLKLAIDQPVGAKPKGGRPIKHLYRHWIAVELARNYDWLFEKRPTTAATGTFARFCKAVFEETQLDTKGFEETLPDILDDAASWFAPNRAKRTRRKAGRAKASQT